MTRIDCVQGIDGIRVDGYAVFRSEDDKVVLSYPSGVEEKRVNNKIMPAKPEGVSFHHGRFIQKLREKAASCER